ncbi:MAG TPA: nickel pincer cofactor biosynthesis protein LarC [Gemmatimonadota bacterium]|nr:nickel pincer cofactor biosynthesis protein LarC [Gemmatimonadota bacterium]
MRVAYLDMFSGVSGDMLLGACLDAGVPLAELQETLAPLGREGVRLSTQRVERHGIAATRCVVEVPDAAGERGLAEILERIEAAGLPSRVAERAGAVFRRLADAEAKVHDTTPEQVHFHEVGALDAIVDVVGGVWCLERLEIEQVRASAFTLGRGWARSAHGVLPVPPPAVIELVRGWPVVEGLAAGELTTPTGAALVTTLAEAGGMPAHFVPAATGYGAGTREIEEQPNLLRIVVGTSSEPAHDLAIVECDLDDLSPQLFEPLAERLYGAGAVEVHWMPVQMKKQRPGVTVRALAPVPAVERVGRALFEETTTLGFRWWPVSRQTLARESGEVETSFGTVAVKRIRRPDGRWETRPEYESCREIARRLERPVRDVLATLTAELNSPELVLRDD